MKTTEYWSGLIKAVMNASFTDWLLLLHLAWCWDLSHYAWEYSHGLAAAGWVVWGVSIYLYLLHWTSTRPHS